MSIPDKRGHFGVLGGKYVPETLMAPLEELEKAYLSIKKDALFQKRIQIPFERLCGKAHAPLFCEKTN